MKTIIILALALTGAATVSNTARAQDFGDFALAAASSIGKEAIGTVQQYLTGMGPGNNKKLVDVEQVQVAKIKNLENKQGIQTINSSFIRDSEITKYKSTQVVDSDKITNEQGLQRINQISIANSKLDDVEITQICKVKTIENKQGLQQINVASFNHLTQGQGIKITQYAAGEHWKNDQGAQSVNIISQ